MDELTIMEKKMNFLNVFVGSIILGFLAGIAIGIFKWF
jgi:hypothetical protein